MLRSALWAHAHLRQPSSSSSLVLCCAARSCSSSNNNNNNNHTHSSTPSLRSRPLKRPANTPTVPPAMPSIIDTPLPPRPANYVPPEQRDPADASLAFMKGGSPLDHLRPAPASHLGPGQEFAPELPERPKPAPVYEDADARRVHSTSVHAGKPILDGKVVDTGEYYFQDNTARGRGAAAIPSRLDSLKQHKGERQAALDAFEEPAAADGTTAAAARKSTVFSAAGAAAPAEDDDGGAVPSPKPQLSRTQQMALDLKKLEYYEGSPNYPQMVQEFRRKYEEEAAGKKLPEDAARAYTEEEVAQGLEAQPLDYLRTSPKLQMLLQSGPQGYDPVTVMQQHGVMRFQAYAFPPSTELGKLKGVEEVRHAVEAHRGNQTVAAIRQRVNALLGRQDDRDDFVATADRPVEDTHLVYRTLGLDAVQRRQMRFMLTDFDYADRQTSFHVMMSYPYADWLHVLYMCLVGWGLYQLQVRYGAYEYYDEFLGLDLRQVPNLKKPFLAGMTALFMVFFLFQPLLVASIATNRAYRIAMKRPIGPP